MSGYKSARQVANHSEECIGRELGTLSSAATGNAVWPSANRAYGIPLRIARTEDVNGLFWQNGTSVTDNADAGIYDVDGNRLISTGSTARSGSSSRQLVSVSFEIDPGLYFLAISLAGTTGTMSRLPTAIYLNRAMGVVVEDSAFPLPSTVTWGPIADAFIPIVGVQYA